MECDPDICRGCAPALGLGRSPTAADAAAADAAAADAEPDALPCCNMRLRLRQHKRVAMGLSDIAGWGAFLLVHQPPARLHILISCRKCIVVCRIVVMRS